MASLSIGLRASVCCVKCVVTRQIQRYIYVNTLVHYVRFTLVVYCAMNYCRLCSSFILLHRC